MKKIIITLIIISLLSSQSRGTNTPSIETELPPNFEANDFCFQVKYLKESLHVLKESLKTLEDQYQTKVDRSDVYHEFSDNRYNDDGDLKIFDYWNNNILIKQKDNWIDHQKQQEERKKSIQYFEWVFLTFTAILAYYNVKFIKEYYLEYSLIKRKNSLSQQKKKSNILTKIRKLIGTYFLRKKNIIKRTSVAFFGVTSIVFWSIYRNKRSHFSKDIDETQTKIIYLEELVDALDSIDGHRRIIEDRMVRLEMLLDETNDAQLIGSSCTQE